MVKTLKNQFKIICDAYLVAFCEKQGFNTYDIECQDVGCNYFVGGFYFSFFDIMFDIDNNIEKGRIVKYFDYCMKNINIKYVNYQHFIKYFKNN